MNDIAFENPAALMVHFGYMFAGPSIELRIFKGWFPTLGNLCCDIDTMLGENKRGFHWTQIEEKFGTMRLYWEIDVHFDSDEDSQFNRTLLEIIRCAEDATSELCIVCGMHGHLDERDRYLLTLCNQHQRQRALSRNRMLISHVTL